MSMSATVRYNPARQKWTVYVSRQGKRRMTLSLGK